MRDKEDIIIGMLRTVMKVLFAWGIITALQYYLGPPDNSVSIVTAHIYIVLGAAGGWKND